MLKKIISNIAKNRAKKAEINFFDLPSREREEIIERAAKLSAQDQRNLMEEYERKFGDLQTNSCE